MISTPNDLIDALGGTGAVAQLCGVKDNTVSGWRQRGLPPWTHRQLRQALDDSGQRYDDALFAIQPPSRVGAA